MALRQIMVFHGEKGFIEVHAPFNAGDYDHHRIELHNQNHTRGTVYRFPATRQYKLEAETFARAAAGRQRRGVHAGGLGQNQKVIDAIFRAGERMDGRRSDRRLRRSTDGAFGNRIDSNHLSLTHAFRFSEKTERQTGQ